MKFVILLLVFVLCHVPSHSESEDDHLVRFRLLRKSNFDPAAIVRIDSSSISQTVDHSISTHSIGHNLISPIDGHYRFDENQSERSDNFHTYKNAMRNLFSNKLNSNLKFNSTGQRNLSYDLSTDQPYPFQKRLAYKKLQSSKSCRCQLQKMQRIVNGQTAEPNQIPWQVSLAERNSHFCGESIKLNLIYFR